MNIIANLLYYLAEMTTELKNESTNGGGITMLVLALFIMGAGTARPMILKYLAICPTDRRFPLLHLLRCGHLPGHLRGARHPVVHFLCRLWRNQLPPHGRHPHLPAQHHLVHLDAVVVPNATGLPVPVFGYEKRKREEKRKNKKFGLVHVFYALNKYGFRSPVLQTLKLNSNGVPVHEIKKRMAKPQSTYQQPVVNGQPQHYIQMDMFKELWRQAQINGYQGATPSRSRLSST